MLTRLIITEKPSVAMRYAAVLGVKGRQDGYLEGRGYLISWCFGHLWGLADAVAYDPKYKKWNKTDLPILPTTWQYQLLPGSQKQMALLRRLMDREDVTEIVNACDPGREGELIFRNVYNLAQCTKPMLRLWVSSMEDEAIREGFAHLRPGLAFNGVYEAALCRAQADWLVGINATRLFSTAYHRTLVIGRVISPTLAMVVNREQEIAGHKPETFYRVCLTCEGVVFQSEKLDQAQAEALAAQCTGQTAVVEELRETEQVRTADGYAKTFAVFFPPSWTLSAENSSWMAMANATVQYRAVQRSGDAPPQLVKEMHYVSFVGLLRSDLFEGLCLGHAPRRCPICGQWFLTTNARPTKYCGGLAPEDPLGRTCRQVGNLQGRAKREKAPDHPLKQIYARRCNTIRCSVRRGKLNPDLAKAMKRLAKNKLFHALRDPAYAGSTYAAEMEQAALLGEAQRGLTSC